MNVIRPDRPRWLLTLLLMLLGSAAAVVHAQTSSLPGGSPPSGSPFVRSTPQFLDVDEAFSFYTSLDARDRVSVHWQIAPEYYLYQDKFQFRINAPETLAGDLVYQMPDGIQHHDEFFGDVVVYYHELQVILSLPADINGPFTLEIEFQGCAEAGLCYPPQRRQLEIYP